jgi:hypothetical protein
MIVKLRACSCSNNLLKNTGWWWFKKSLKQGRGEVDGRQKKDNRQFAALYTPKQHGAVNAELQLYSTFLQSKTVKTRHLFLFFMQSFITKTKIRQTPQLYGD